MERAFAAELLAPADGIQQELGGRGELIDEAELERIGQHFGVSSWVIQHQIENQLAFGQLD